MLKKMRGVSVLILLLMSLVSAYTCLNQSEGSHCASPDAPGGLTPSETPQFIVITFDDALHQPAYDYTEKLLGYGHKNPNGAPLPVTYFISTEYTDYHTVQKRYAQGCEIAVHTMSHTTSTKTDYDTWRAEILGCKEALSKYAQIPAEEIVGFRAPFLQYNDASMNVLYDNGFLYESSITEKFGRLSTDGESYIWPYTFDNLGAQSHDVGEAPKRTYPGLWEIPMWSYYVNGVQKASMDYPGGHAELLAMFKENFTKRYTGNRAPIGVFLHPGWLSEDAHAAALNDFLTWAQQNDDVWVVTNHQLIQWMQDPHSSSEMATFTPVQYREPATGNEIADGWDNNGNGEVDEETVHNCNYGSNHFNTNAECPAEYPVPQVVPTKIVTATQVGDSILVDNCTESDWSSAITYVENDLVTYEGHTYRAKWYNKNTTPGGEWGPWEDKGACSYTEVIYHGSITPQGGVHVVEGESVTFTITPDMGYAVSSIVLDGEAQAISNSITLSDVTENHTLSVSFVLDDGAVYHTINSSATTGGTVTPAGAITVLEGTDQSFSISASEGYEISDVIVDGESKGKIESFSFSSVNENHTIAADFTLIPVPTYVVTASSGSNGTVTPIGDSTVTEGDSIVYSFQADAGYKVSDILVDGNSVGAATSHTLKNISKNQTLEVYFEEVSSIEYTLTATAGDNGSISPSGLVPVLEGESQIFTFTAAEGYEVASVVVDGIEKGKLNSYEITAVTKDMTISVTFTEQISGGLCDGVSDWDPNENWTAYSLGDTRVSGGKVWEVTNVAYTFYDPAGSLGYLGWKELGSCN